MSCNNTNHHISETNPTGPVMTGIQLVTACALAREFNHRWGHIADVVILGNLLPEELEGYCANCIAAMTWAAIGEDDPWPGIVSPVVQESEEGNVVVHETQRGRLKWTIHWDGSVVVNVQRPGALGTVMTATIGPAIPGQDREMGLVVSGPIGMRHFQALSQVIDTLRALDAGEIHRDVKFRAELATAKMQWREQRLNREQFTAQVLSRLERDVPAVWADAHGYVKEAV